MTFDDHAFEVRADAARAAARACTDRVGAELRSRRVAETAEAGTRLTELRTELGRRAERIVRADPPPTPDGPPTSWLR